MDSKATVLVGPIETLEKEALTSLYNAVGWSVYTQDPTVLIRAIEGSDFVVEARAKGTLVGLARAISDDTSIVYIQDILVHPDHQGQGLGKRLVQAILQRYDHVRQKVLLTDNRPEQIAFYESLAFHNTRNLVNTPLNAFVRIEGQELS